jgi:hypothetical protein
MEQIILFQRTIDRGVGGKTKIPDHQKRAESLVDTRGVREEKL